jgi:predicted Zn-dependent protease
MIFLAPALANTTRIATVLIAACLTLAWPSRLNANNLPQLGDGEEMSIGAEKKLGMRIAREIYRDPDYIDDPLISGYLQRIWQPLLAAAKRRGDIAPQQEQLAWELMTGKDRSINAFALPGGYFGVHLGLIAAVSTRDELASVLAHELTHVSQRHIARQISKQNAQAPWVMGAMILGALAASKNPEAANAVITGSQAVSAQAQLNFSRDMEREADRIGFAIMQEAGMDVRGFTGMFDKLQQANRINDNGSFPYLRSHPLTTERLGDMQARLQLLPTPADSPTVSAQSVEHSLIATRARLLSDSSVDKLRAELALAQAALRNPAQRATPAQQIRQLTQLYGGAMASLKQRDNEAALSYAKAAKELLFQLPFGPSAQLEHAQAAIEWIVIEAYEADPAPSESMRGRALAAGLALQNLPSQSQERSSLLAWARLARDGIGPGDPSANRLAAIDALQSALARRSHDAPLWNALAQLYDAQGQALRGLRARAEAQVALLDYGAALDRLKAAQDLARSQGASHIEASILDTRTRAVQTLVQEWQSERDKP